ncbi:hypothetical protein MLD38_019895 [Melastoma candidum]|uniref:Uncharacterized protein n=1 Tax=Melastoma candidum TaxID=119954 RepID=A0ACB9QJ70_9MYRT|nr:hypothetical protein MLD38_019895 [Melastoma candidum]
MTRSQQSSSLPAIHAHNTLFFDLKGDGSQLIFSIKFFSIILCFLVGFLLNIQSVRYYSHAEHPHHRPLQEGPAEPASLQRQGRIRRLDGEPGRILLVPGAEGVLLLVPTIPLDLRASPDGHDVRVTRVRALQAGCSQGQGWPWWVFARMARATRKTKRLRETPAWQRC